MLTANTSFNLPNCHFRAACSNATKGFSNKVFKGFGSYQEAHHAWRAFVDHGTLPPDVLTGLFGRPPPLPPTVLQPNIRGLGHLADPPSLMQTPLCPSPTPFTPIFTGKRRASNSEDFWVVLTGASPGVYQGRLVIF